MGDIKSDCWVGLELSSPSAIGTIRFFPRGSCPGCQTGGNPACLSIQKEKGKCDEGGCRMSGGKFQGATSSAGPWSDLATIPTTVPVSEDSWTSLSVEDGSEFTHVRYMSAPLGYCNVAEVVRPPSTPNAAPLCASCVSRRLRGRLGQEFYPPQILGWLFTAFVLLGGGAYLGGGIAYGQRVGGGKGVRAHPHFSRMVEVGALVMDGLAVVRGGKPRGGGSGYAPLAAAGGSGRPTVGGKKQKKEKKERKEKKEKRPKERASAASAPAPAPSGGGGGSMSAAPDQPAAAAPAAGTAAGDGALPSLPLSVLLGCAERGVAAGGRWGHVPS